MTQIVYSCQQDWNFVKSFQLVDFNKCVFKFFPMIGVIAYDNETLSQNM